jgi:amphi-Trp domain-containing protein
VQAGGRLLTAQPLLLGDFEFERGGLRFTVHVPDEIDFKLEIEIGEDERELEVEITW